MSELLLRANELRVPTLRTFYDTIPAEGERRYPARLKPTGKAGRDKKTISFNLLQRLRRHADAVPLFVSYPVLPFTDNLGERAIHMPKVKQKISGSFPHFARYPKLLRHSLLPGHAAQTRPWHARCPATRLRWKPDSASPRLNRYIFLSGILLFFASAHMGRIVTFHTHVTSSNLVSSAIYEHNDQVAQTRSD